MYCHGFGALLLCSVLAACAVETSEVAQEVTAQGSQASQLGATGQDIRARFDQGRLMDDLLSLTGLGPRVAGGPAERAAGDFIAASFRASGLEVTEDEFPVIYYLDHGSSFSGPGVTGIETLAMVPSIPGTVTAPVIDCGLGRPGECPAVGSPFIALLRRGTIYFSAKVANVAAAGAVGAVISNSAPGMVVGLITDPPPYPTPFAPLRIPALPVVGISREDGDLLRGQTLPEMTLSVDTVVGPSTSRNIVGRSPGTDPSAGLLVMGAHYDGVQVGAGANDNAASVAALLEAARVLTTGHRTKASIDFVAFGAEDMANGLNGSWYYIAPREAALASGCLGMLNLELIGRGPRLMVGHSDPTQPEPDLAFLSFAAQTASAVVGEPAEHFHAQNSDHLYFEMMGLPVAVVHRDPVGVEDDPDMHTPLDVAAAIEPATAELTGEAAATIAYEWAKNPALRARKAIRLDGRGGPQGARGDAE